MTQALLQELLMALRANDADCYKGWLVLGIEQLGRDVAGEVESECMVHALTAVEKDRLTPPQRGVSRYSLWRKKNKLKRLMHWDLADIAFPEMRNKDKGATNAIIKVSGGISSTKHHDMKLYFAITPGIALSALFATAPVKADSALIRHSIDYQGPKIHEIGRSIGWIQAACFFAGPSGIRNKISPDMAKMSI